MCFLKSNSRGKSIIGFIIIVMFNTLHLNAQTYQILPCSFTSNNYSVKIRWQLGYYSQNSILQTNYYLLPPYFNAYCKSLSDEPTLPTDQINIYPNPFCHSFSVAGITADARIEINNLAGEKVFSSTIGNNEPVTLNWLGPGTYILIIRNKEQQIIHHKKIIKLP